MMNSLLGGMSFYMDEIYTFESSREQWKEMIIQKFRESRNLPRKKKKQVRKELQVDWNIACWDPFQF